jgi:hypothetical protein
MSERERNYSASGRKSWKTIEWQRCQARNIMRIRRKGQQQGSMTMVFKMDEEGCHQHLKKKGIEDACIRENSQRFAHS